MAKKNILIVCPGTIYPIKMGSQVRMYNMIKGLSKDHCVEVISKVSDNGYLSKEYSAETLKICSKFYPILAPNKENIFKRIYYKIKRDLIKPGWFPDILYYSSIKKLQKKILQIANSKKYDIILCEYWHASVFYEKLKYRPYLSLDAHDLNFEKYELMLKSKKSWQKSQKKSAKYKELELKYTGQNDLIISVSENDYQFFKKSFPEKDHLKIPIGQDLSSYLSYQSNLVVGKKILFYGSMSSRQNIKAFFRLYNHILPIIKLKTLGVELIVLGANPPEKINKLHNGKDVFITGFVKDIREWISKTSLMILPLEIAGGFRTRVVEVMAMGVPIIGTKNALDCIEMKNGIHGFITDNDSEMADFAVKLLNDPKLRNKIGEECKKFVTEKYSIEATYGKLSKFFLELK